LRIPAFPSGAAAGTRGRSRAPAQLWRTDLARLDLSVT